MENLQKSLRELRKQVAEIEAQIIELTPKPEPKIDVKAEVLKMSDEKLWKTYIETGVVENIIDLLDGCYVSYIECIQVDYPTIKPKDLIGKFGSNKWLNFQLETIKRLLNPSNIDMDEDFFDTAGGCDEVAWDAGFDVIREMNK